MASAHESIRERVAKVIKTIVKNMSSSLVASNWLTFLHKKPMMTLNCFVMTNAQILANDRGSSMNGRMETNAQMGVS